MILADKIIYLRKKEGWSQEQLAEQLHISRQSVSKWESGMSIPDLDKILKMSQLFGVSTDYLLKDEIEREVPSENSCENEETEGRSVSLEEANEYVELVEKTADKIGVGVGICILSPIILIMLGILAENNIVGISEDMAGGFGTALLLMLLTVGVTILIPNGMKLSKFDYLEKETIILQYGVQGVIEKKKREMEAEYRAGMTVGVACCIVGICPLLIAAGMDASDVVLGLCVSTLLLVVACAVFIFISKGMRWNAYEKLLQVGEFTKEQKFVNRKTDPIAGVYWCVVTAVYLAVSFYSNAWNRTWIIWPVAGVAFAALAGILDIIVKKKEQK